MSKSVVRLQHVQVQHLCVRYVRYVTDDVRVGCYDWKLAKNERSVNIVRGLKRPCLKNVFLHGNTSILASYFSDLVALVALYMSNNSEP